MNEEEYALLMNQVRSEDRDLVDLFDNALDEVEFELEIEDDLV